MNSPGSSEKGLRPSSESSPQDSIAQDQARARSETSSVTWRRKMTVHPQSSRPYRELHTKPAPARYSHGTREGRLTVAPFRAWRGSTHPVAWGPTINAIPYGSFDTSDPREGIQPRCSGLRVTGHRYLPI